MISMTSGRTRSSAAGGGIRTGKPFGRPLVTTPSPQSMCAASAGASPTLLGILERLGRECVQHALSGRCRGRIHRRQVPRLNSNGRSAFRATWRPTHNPRWSRTRLRWQPERQRVCAQRFDRLYPLVLSAAASVRAAVTIGGRDRFGIARRGIHGDRAGNVYAVEAAMVRCYGKQESTTIPCPASPARGFS